MRKLMIFLFAAVAVTFAATATASAAPFSPALCKAAAKASVISKAQMRLLRLLVRGSVHLILRQRHRLLQ
jgi:hypothetical protein